MWEPGPERKWRAVLLFVGCVFAVLIGRAIVYKLLGGE